MCRLIRRDVEGVICKSVDWDLQGRVLLTEPPSLGVVVFNIYAVNRITNDYRDQSTGKVVGDRHYRKKAFHLLPAKEVKGYEEQGWGVMVADDINISRTIIDLLP